MSSVVPRGVTIAALHIGIPQTLPAEPAEVSSKPWTTASFKNSVPGPVWLSSQNLEGDAQADLVQHGGTHKAVCVYPADHYPWWRQQLNLPDLAYGAFSENISVAGITEADICIGDIWSIGESVAVQVSQPRQPCWKLARRWQIRDLALLVQQTGRTGWYLRVLTEGHVTCGDGMKLVERLHADWTIDEANRVMHHDKADIAAAVKLAMLPPLSPSWRESLVQRAESRRGTGFNDSRRLSGPEMPSAAGS